MLLDVKILDARLTPDQLQYATPGSAGFDLRAARLYSPVTLLPNERYKISTGIAIHLNDKRYAGLLMARSGMAHKMGVALSNGVGLIDSDYQGEIIVSVINLSMSDTITINPMDRIAQLAIVPVVQVWFNLVDAFDEATVRGTGGFGSTGK